MKVGEANSAVSEIEPTAMRSAGTDSLVGLKEMSVPGQTSTTAMAQFQLKLCYFLVQSTGSSCYSNEYF